MPIWPRGVRFVFFGIAIGNWQLEIGNALAEAAGVEPARDERGGLANRCHTIRRRLRGFRIAETSDKLQLVATHRGEPWQALATN